MTMTISVRLEHLNSVTYGGQQQHDMRDAKRIPKYVDKDRSDKNSILIAGPSADHLQQEIIRHRKKAKQRGFRKDGRLALSGIVTFGTEAQSIINDMKNRFAGRRNKVSPEPVRMDGPDRLSPPARWDGRCESAPAIHR